MPHLRVIIVHILIGIPDIIFCTYVYNCNERPSLATENPIGGKACSPTKGGLLRYISNTSSNHKVSSLKFAHFQGRLSRHITSPSENSSRVLAWGLHGQGNPGLAVVIIPPLPPNVTNGRAEPQKTPSVEKHARPPRVVYCAIYPTLPRITKSRVTM